jgi:hypothetical protein
MALLFDPAATYELPLSKGGDLYVTFTYMPLVVDGNGDPVLDAQGKKQYAEADYPTDAAVSFAIDSDPPIATVAAIDGSKATVLVDKAEADTVKNGKLWRTVITYAGVDSRDVVMCNGTIVRYDGAAKR